MPRVCCDILMSIVRRFLPREGVFLPQYGAPTSSASRAAASSTHIINGHRAQWGHNELVWNSLILVSSSSQATDCTPHPWFMPMCQVGWAAALVLKNRTAIEMFDVFPFMFPRAFLRGFMFSQNQLRLLPSKLSRPQLRTLLYQYLTRLDIIADFEPRRSSRSSNDYSKKLFSPQICW